MNLQQALQQGALSGLNDADALAFGNVVVDGTPDSQLYHWDGIIATLAAESPGNGLTAQQAATSADILSTMPVGFYTLDRLLTTGCVLSDPAFRATVAAMEAAEPPDAVLILNAILAIGATPQSTRWASWGVSQPLLSDITAARSQMSASSWWANIMNEIVGPMLGTSTIEQIKAAIAGA